MTPPSGSKPGNGFSTVSFLSDLGTVDESVGVVKSVIRSLAPHAVVIDLTHGIEAHDVRAGGLSLARAIQYIDPGVILAVVDPGVGGSRRAIAVEVANGAAVLVGPDNGLMASAVAMAGGATAAVELSNTDYHLEAVSPTFAARDIFAPVAAHLCNGVPLNDFGPVIDPFGLMPGLMPLPRLEGDALVCEVLWVDSYGNIQLNIGIDELEPVAGAGGIRDARFKLEFSAGGRVGWRMAKVAATYSDIAGSDAGLIVDSYGLVSIAFSQRSATAELGITTGSAVTIRSSDAEKD
jgi:S-adenosylmethionine hydrolase